MNRTAEVLRPSPPEVLPPELFVRYEQDVPGIRDIGEQEIAGATPQQWERAVDTARKRYGVGVQGHEVTLVEFSGTGKQR